MAESGSPLRGLWRRLVSHPLRRVFRQISLLSPALGRICEPSVDVFVISFPKCGRTWLRMQLGRVLQQHFGIEVQDLISIEEMAGQAPGIPHLRMLHADKPHRSRPEELRPAVVDYFRHRKVVFLIRDPRDVVVSLYMHRTRRGMAHPFDGTLSDFLDEPIGGFDTLLRYYNLWARHGRFGENHLLVRYEDMHADPVRELRRVLDFAGLADVKPEVVEEAVSFTRFDRMRAMEKSGQYQDKKLRPGDPNDEESFKTRKGRVGGYVESLEPAEVEALEIRMRENLTAFYGNSAAGA